MTRSGGDRPRGFLLLYNLAFPVILPRAEQAESATSTSGRRKDAADLVCRSGLGVQDPQLRSDDPPGLLCRAGDRASGGRGERKSTPTSSTSWRPGSSWAASSVRGGLRPLTSGIDPQSWRRPPKLAGGQRLLRMHPGGVDRIDPLLVPAAVSVLVDDRRGRAGRGDRNCHRADRLFLERLLLRCGLRPALGRLLSRRVACLGSPGRRRLDFTVGDDFAAGASRRRSMRRSPGLPCSACCWRISLAAVPPAR